MASVKILKKWYIPYAVRISFSHGEACQLTNPTVADTAAALSVLLSDPRYWWIAIIAAQIRRQVAEMISKNETSGGYGIRVKFNFATGTITRISRRCITWPSWMRRFNLPSRPCGPSPCP